MVVDMKPEPSHLHSRAYLVIYWTVGKHDSLDVEEIEFVRVVSGVLDGSGSLFRHVDSK